MPQAVHSAELIDPIEKDRVNLLVHFPSTYHDGYPYLVTKAGDCVRITEPQPLDILRSEFRMTQYIEDSDERHLTYVNLVAEIQYHICNLQATSHEYVRRDRGEPGDWEGLGAWKALHTYMLEIYEQSKTWGDEGVHRVLAEMCKKVNDVYINSWREDPRLDRSQRRRASSTGDLNDRLLEWRRNVAREPHSGE